MPKKQRLFKLTGPNGAACHGGTGSWHLPRGKRPGKWMPAIKNPEPCHRGYHVVGIADLLFWAQGVTEAYEVEVRGETVSDYQKVCVEQARLVRKLNWSDEMLRLFAADCAARVLHIFEARHPSDERPRNAIIAARRFARGDATRDELRQAKSASYYAAEDAAEAAAESYYAATRAAAYYAAADASYYDASYYAASAAEAAEDAGRKKERAWQQRRLLAYLEGRVKRDWPLPTQCVY